MAKVYNGDANKIRQPSIFRPTSNLPLDERTIVEFFSDLTDSSVWEVSAYDTRYEGMIVYVQETKYPYVLIDGTKPNEAASWQLVGSGVGTGGSLEEDILEADGNVLVKAGTIKDVITQVIDIISSGDTNTMYSLIDYIASADTQVKEDILKYVNKAFDDSENALMDYADSGDTEVRNAAKDYTDSSISDLKNTLLEYIDSGDTEGRDAAKDYTDTSISDLKNALLEYIDSGDTNVIDSLIGVFGSELIELYNKEGSTVYDLLKEISNKVPKIESLDDDIDITYSGDTVYLSIKDFHGGAI